VAECKKLATPFTSCVLEMYGGAVCVGLKLAIWTAAVVIYRDKNTVKAVEADTN
jgi:hypothetical protein